MEHGFSGQIKKFWNLETSSAVVEFLLWLGQMQEYSAVLCKQASSGEIRQVNLVDQFSPGSVVYNIKMACLLLLLTDTSLQYSTATEARIHVVYKKHWSYEIFKTVKWVFKIIEFKLIF